MGTYGSDYGGYGGGMGMGSYGGVRSYGMGSYGGVGYGGYGGMGTGMGYGGMEMGGMMGPNGMPMDPNNPSLTQALESTTQSTFALLDSIVQTFSGVAQMLESTFMATHSSFFAMAGVADQLRHLCNALVLEWKKPEEPKKVERSIDEYSHLCWIYALYLFPFFRSSFVSGPHLSLGHSS